MSKKGNFLLGAGVGLGLGLLFAPEAGDKTRAKLKAKCAELYEKVKNIDVEEVKEDITDKLAELQAELKDLDKEKVARIAKEKATKVKEKANELVKAAVAKGTPAVEKAAKEVRSAAVEFLKKVTDKLENGSKAEKKPAKETK